MPTILRPIRLMISFLVTVLAVALDAQAPAWHVDTAPLLRVAGSTPDGRAVFGMASWATRVGPDEVALADGSDRLVRIFGLDGRQRRTLGRDGRGPGEFQSIGWMASCGTDSLFVWDIVSARMSVLHPRDGYARSWTDPELQGPMQAACSPRQEFAFPVRLRRGTHSRPVMNAATADGVRYRIYADTSDVQTVDADGAAVRDVDAGIRQESASGNLAAGRFAMMDRPLGLATYVVFSDDRIVRAFTDSGWVYVSGRTAAESNRFRIAPASTRVTAADRDAAIVALLRRTPGSVIDNFNELGRALPLPERAPAFYDLLASSDGLLWFVVSPPGARTTHLAVYRRDGAAVATLAVPVAITLFEIGTEHLLGRVENEDGEQELILYRYRRR